ncbi:hypothetical protein [Anaerovibrio sp. RM50]|uniref:hypothetical protein n=1 Tax=Anaerovibrio sp. RM50 TaxID=1200557 RepID=UPI000484775D|nr:hypothetical protein [Anaerovibrio sp. RM50]
MNDKMKHMIAGFIIALLFGCLLNDPFGGFLISLVAGLAKEIWDYFGHGVSELEDFLATAQGGAIGCVILYLPSILGVW